MRMRTTTTIGGGIAALLLAGLGAQRFLRSSAGRFARMAGSSIATPDAAGWVTDFLNAAYYARPHDARDIDDLRLARAIVATQWYCHGQGRRRLRAYDVLPLHRAFGRARFLATARSPRGMLDREQLLAGAARLHGPWFPAAYADDARRAWGIVFPTVEERAAYRPMARLRHGALGPLTPPVAPFERQVWHTYEPVPVPLLAGLLAGIARPETWPDYASELGSFTPVRAGGLADQTFEIEIMARVAPRAPVSTRGYVTVTRLAGVDNPAGLRAFVDEFNDGLARQGNDEPPAVPAGATPLLGLDLTTHAGHFLGRAVSKLVVYREAGEAAEDGEPAEDGAGEGFYLREVGVWDPMDWYVGASYRAAGAAAQRAFWGMESPDESMLHQMVLRTAIPTPLAPPTTGR